MQPSVKKGIPPHEGQGGSVPPQAEVAQPSKPADLLARLKAALFSTSFTIRIDGGGVPQQQTITLDRVVMLQRSDLAEVIAALTLPVITVESASPAPQG